MKKAFIYIILTTLLFSTMEITLKMVSNQFNPIQLTFIRFFVGSIVLLPLAVRNLKVRGISLKKDDIIYFLLTGFICVVVSMSLYQLSILYCKASIVAIIFSCNPIFVVPLAHYILKEKINKNIVISMIISVIGMIYILNPLNLSGNIYGFIFAVLSAVSFALYGVMGKSKSGKYGGIVMTSFSFLMGSLEILALMLLSNINSVSSVLTEAGLGIFSDIPVFQGITVNNILNLVYISVFVTGLGYAFYFLAMEETSAVVTSIVFFIKPALAPVLALIILKESIAFNTIVGIVMIVIGSFITFFTNNRRSEPIGEAVDELDGEDIEQRA